MRSRSRTNQIFRMAGRRQLAPMIVVAPVFPKVGGRALAVALVRRNQEVPQLVGDREPPPFLPAPGPI